MFGEEKKGMGSLKDFAAVFLNKVISKSEQTSDWNI
jgi:hypothetical protein